jgi:hypothetical protein
MSGASLADGFGEDEATDGDAAGADGWSETCCAAATGWPAVCGPDPLAASAVPAAATTATAPITMAAFSPVIRRNKEIRSTVLPCSGGGADGHSAASSRAASPRCDRPRWCQSAP